MTCPFCAEIATGMLPDREGVHIASREICRSANFIVVADISPLVVGHLLVLPRQHLLSFGAVPSGHLPELRALLAALSARLATRYGEPMLLEHGTDSNSDGGGCVSHAHLHLVPGVNGMAESLSAFRVTKVASLSDLRKWADSDEPYLYVGDSTEAGHVADQLGDIPKQFLRIEVARLVGIRHPLWDWRRHIQTGNLNRTVSELRSGLGDQL